MRVLLVEPNGTVATAIEKRLREAKISLDHLSHPDEVGNMNADDMANYAGLLIGKVDDPVALTRLIRELRVEIPVAILWDTKNPELAVQSLSAGADDFVVKPFNSGELKARLHAVSRRMGGGNDTSYQIGPLTLFADGRDPEVDGKRIKLSHREHSIFYYLARNRGRVMSKEAVYTAVYGAIDGEPFDKVIDVYICKLRKKLAEATDGQQFIETVYCRGYKLDTPENTVVQRLGGGGRRAA
jgi:two-component system cell cycle response regulator CtrA